MDQSLEQSNASGGDELPEGITEFPFEEFAGGQVTTEWAGIAMPCGVEVDLTIELGRTRMARTDVLQLCGGSVVPLDQSAGDPVDVYADGRLVARGEVLVLDGNFCVRITELIDRMKACA